MLFLERKSGQVVMIGHDVRMTVKQIIVGAQPIVRLGFEAPKHIQIDREEVFFSKGGKDWQGPPAGVFADGWLCEDKWGIWFTDYVPDFSESQDGWLVNDFKDLDVSDMIAWRFPQDLPFNKRIVKVGPEAERGVPCAG
jgi:carbon storage regulator CsrA